MGHLVTTPVSAFLTTHLLQRHSTGQEPVSSSEYLLQTFWESKPLTPLPLGRGLSPSRQAQNAADGS